jgi:hypothetical protein
MACMRIDIDFDESLTEEQYDAKLAKHCDGDQNKVRYIKGPRVVVNWTEDQKGQNIREEDVVRPKNHKYSVPDTNNRHGNWRKLSTAECPTYGTCEFCWKSGPTGKFCNECERSPDKLKPRYKFVRFDVEKILDSVTLAKLLRMNHEVAKADRYSTPMMQRLMIYEEPWMRARVNEIYEDYPDYILRDVLIAVTIAGVHNMLI